MDDKKCRKITQITLDGNGKEVGRKITTREYEDTSYLWFVLLTCVASAFIAVGLFKTLHF